MEENRDVEIGRDQRLGLLVSVRNWSEAEMVVSLGAEILDVKEPARGGLGQADAEIIQSIVSSFGHHIPVSAAFGELEDCETSLAIHGSLPGLAFTKCGLANTAGTRWQERIKAVWQSFRRCSDPVAVAYVDWERSQAPCPYEIIEVAASEKLAYLLLDTCNKDGRSSLELLDHNELLQMISLAHRFGMQVVLAGSIRLSDVEKAKELRADLIGVRGAVCQGGREQAINESLLKSLRCRILATPNLIV